MRPALPEGYRLQRIGESFYVTTAEAVFAFEHVTEHREGLSAELVTSVLATSSQNWARLTLAAPRSRADVARRLHEMAKGPDWATMIDVACRAVVEEHRRGTPSIALTGEPARGVVQWLVPGLVPMRVATILYGDGGSGKSFTALALALCALRGAALGESRAWPTRRVESVLYLDWESDEYTVHRRLRALCRAEQLDEIPAGIRYLRMDRSLADSLPHIQRECAEHAAELVILDSWLPACGPQPESADAVSRAMGAVRALGGVTTFIIAHVTKASAESGAPARPYGSVFSGNLARSTIEATGDAGLSRNTLSVTFRHSKANDGPLQRPNALTYTFSGTDEEPEIALEADTPDPEKLGLPAQILAALDQARSVGELATELGAPRNSVLVALRRLEKRDKVGRLTAPVTSKGDKVLYIRQDAME